MAPRLHVDKGRCGTTPIPCGNHSHVSVLCHMPALVCWMNHVQKHRALPQPTPTYIHLESAALLPSLAGDDLSSPVSLAMACDMVTALWGHPANAVECQSWGADLGSATSHKAPPLPFR